MIKLCERGVAVDVNQNLYEFYYSRINFFNGRAFTEFRMHLRVTNNTCDSLCLIEKLNNFAFSTVLYKKCAFLTNQILNTNLISPICPSPSYC